VNGPGPAATKARPERSTATQLEVLGHETALRACPGSSIVPALHAVPSQAKTRPSESTARQKVGVGHDTPVSPELSVPDPGGSEATGWGAE